MIDRLSAEEALAQKGIFATTVEGVSMRPLLKGRVDTVRIAPITAPLKKYDVVLFRREGQLVLHRIVAIQGEQYAIRGDNCIGCDLVSQGQILGIMTHFTRKGKQLCVDSPGYRLYSRLWVGLFPVRKLWLRLKQLVKRIVK